MLKSAASRMRWSVKPRCQTVSLESVVSFGAVVLEGFDEEFGVAFDLEEAAAVVGSAGDEEGSRA
jgi:hypothetical protein